MSSGKKILISATTCKLESIPFTQYSRYYARSNGIIRSATERRMGMDKELAKTIVDSVAQDLSQFKFNERHDNLTSNIVGLVKKR